MQFAYERPDATGSDWREALVSIISFRTWNVMNIDRLIDKAERGEWSGLWW